MAVFSCMLIVMFLFLFFSGLLTNLRQLEALSEALPIEARISNLNGSLSSGMMIQERVIQALEDSGYVADLNYTSEIAAAMGEVSGDEAAKIERGEMTFPLGLGVNRAEALLRVPAEGFTFAEGAGSDLLTGTEPVCVIREQEMDQLGLSVGDSIRVTLFSVTYPGDNSMKKYNRLGVYELRIVGSFRIPEGETVTRSAQMIFPVRWQRKIQEQAGSMFFADSARFRVAKPLDLNAFKAEMDEAGLLPVISEANASQHGVSLTVNDETFIKTATRLRENITLTELLMPFIIVIVGFLGFVVSYLLLQSRRPEIAIMRSLGVSRRKCFRMLLFESAIPVISGCLAGVVASAFLVDMDAVLGFGVGIPFFVVYMAGTAVALKMLGKFSVMQLLTALD